MKIYKYTLQVTDLQEIELPLNSHLLSVQEQGNEPQLWAVVDETETRKEKVRIATIGTGNPIGVDLGGSLYMGTYQLNNGQLVFHVFRLGH